jgi:hypothetical protein
MAYVAGQQKAPVNASQVNARRRIDVSRKIWLVPMCVYGSHP